jgi:hypothetical protein
LARLGCDAPGGFGLSDERNERNEGCVGDWDWVVEWVSEWMCVLGLLTAFGL